MDRQHVIDLVRKIILYILLAAGAYLYWLVMLLIFNFVTFRYISLHITQIVQMAAVGTAVTAVIYGYFQWRKIKKKEDM